MQGLFCWRAQRRKTMYQEKGFYFAQDGYKSGAATDGVGKEAPQPFALQGSVWHLSERSLIRWCVKFWRHVLQKNQSLFLPRSVPIGPETAKEGITLNH